MKISRRVTGAEKIRRMSYPDFVAFLKQENAPPGGAETLSWWIEHGGVRARSTLLDLACTTGFSGRNVALATGCGVHGIDLSAPAISEARARARAEGISGRARYRVANAESLPFADESFSHVVAGSCFGFFNDRRQALDEVARVLEDGGKLGVATFYYTRPPPRSLLDRVAECAGFRPSPGFSRDYWNGFMAKRLAPVKEAVRELPPLSVDSIYRYAAAQAIEGPKRWTAEERLAVFERLARDRLVFNEHRRYQAYTRSIWVRRPR